MPFCDGEKPELYYKGPVCGSNGFCSCIDQKNGHVSVTTEGTALTAGITLPRDFFGGWMMASQFDCIYFTSNPLTSRSLSEEFFGVPAEILADISGQD